MTLDQFHTQVHALYRGDGNTPASGETKYTQRTALLLAAINIWDNQEGVLWDELWSTLTGAGDGDKTVNASDLDYDMPTDFRFLGSYVRTTNSEGKHTYYKVIKPQEAELYKNTSDDACFVSGNKNSGFVLTFLKQPNAGDTINYPYYKEAFEPSSSSHVIEMSDPYFAVHFVVGKLHEQEGAGDRARISYSIADQKLKNMKLRNMMLPHDQSNAPRSTDLNSGFGSTGGWGRSRYGDII